MPRVPTWIKRFWKPVLALLIIVLVARHFIRILSRPELAPYPFALRLEYLIPCGSLYLLAHSCWAWFWVRLMRSQGMQVYYLDGLRAYFVSQLGKYVPGKFAAIAIRMAMLHKQTGGKPLRIGVTATYETLTTMSAGSILGLLLLPRLGVMPRELSENIEIVFAIAALPAVLGVLHKLAARRIAKMRGPDAPPLPSPPLFLLFQGLLQGAFSWCLLGVSLGLAIQAVAPEPPSVSLDHCLADLGAVTLSYVAGFFVLVAPGGLGVREAILQYALTPRFEPVLGESLAMAQAAVVALVLRLTWTIFELLAIVGFFILRKSKHPHGSLA
jgi:hypothetical protein